MAERDYELPDRPQSPSPGDCCGSGCNPCVLDIYEQELRIWKSLSLKSDSPMRNTLSTDSYSKCVVSSIESVTDDVILFTISFEDNNTVCNLFPGAHIILRASSVDETYSLTRQYTPISPVNSVGCLDLIIKVYPKGRMSALVREWSIGSLVRLRGPFGSFQIKQNEYKQVSMLACGTGITPMYQIMRHVLDNEEDETRLVLLYSLSRAKDILMKKELDEFSNYWNVRIVYILTRDVGRSFPLKYKDLVSYRRIDKEIIGKELAPASPLHKALICGTKNFARDMKDILIDNFGFRNEMLKIF